MTNIAKPIDDRKLALALTLDCLDFAPFREDQIHEIALESRPDMDLFEHELGFIRRRVVGRNPDKPSLAFIPDGPATIESYDGVIETLSGRFNIAVLEMPGFGFSYAKAPAAIKFEEGAQILAAAIKDMDLPRLTLVGGCIQALFAARIAEILPDHVDALIMAQSGDFEAEAEWSRIIDPTGTLRQPIIGQVAFRKNRTAASVDWWLPFCSGPKTPLADLQAQARIVQSSGCCYALASQMQALAAMDPRPTLSPRQPTAVIWGLADQSHRMTNKRSTLNVARDARYIERDELAHFPDLEDPELIAETALALLEA